MKLIPTPNEFQSYNEIRSITSLRKVTTNVDDAGETLTLGLSLLRECIPTTENGVELMLPHSDDMWFRERNAAEQGYILTRDGDLVTLHFLARKL